MHALLDHKNKRTYFDYNNEIIGVDQEDDEAQLNELLLMK